jgi:ribosomal protein S18 acetylase RimI-like enzyme
MPDLISSVHKTQEYFLWALSKETFETHGVTAYAPDIAEPNLNFAMQTGEIDGGLEEILQKVEAFYKAQALPWLWQLNSSRDQSDLKEMLSKHGYQVREKYSTFIGFIDHFSLQENTQSVIIKEVEEAQLSDWLLPLQEAFQSTEGSAHVYLEAHIRALHKEANFHHFVAYAGDEAVSASTLSLSSHGARLDDLGTKPAYQRKGIGSAMTRHLMKVAKNLGYEWICLDASEEGALLYKSMGFQELCQNEMYGKA